MTTCADSPRRGRAEHPIFPMRDGERQVAPTLEGIRRDHVARYEWAAKRLKGRVVDIACGIGYGTQILARAGCHVLGVDVDAAAIAYGREHYRHGRARLKQADASQVSGEFHAAVCFEAIEHLEDPRPMLRAARAAAGYLIASVPNEAVLPWNNTTFHVRHYLRWQFERLLAECGWKVAEWWGQEGAESDVVRDLEGRTLIAVAERCKPRAAASVPAKPKAPDHVAICGLGPSVQSFLNVCKVLGGRSAFCDQVWTINALGNIFDADIVFHMDDIRVQEARAAANPTGNIAPMVRWLKKHPGPIITSRAHPDYPGLVEFPLEQVINDLKFAYFNSTAAYAIAYAIWLGVKRISVFGMDFTYANAHRAEKGRANVEFLLGIAAARGIKLTIPKDSSLMDACEDQPERLYGYDTLNVYLQKAAGDRCLLTFSEREKVATADEIEARYDHRQHPNPLLEGPAA